MVVFVLQRQIVFYLHPVHLVKHNGCRKLYYNTHVVRENFSRQQLQQSFMCLGYACWVRIHVARHDHARLVGLDQDGLLYQWFSTVVHD